MKIKALVGTALLVALLVGPDGQPASAADLLYNTPAPAPMYSGGPYVTIKGGVNFTGDDPSFLDTAGGAGGFTTIDRDTGFDAAIALGYAFGNRWGPFAPRLEAELGYLANDVNSISTFTAGGVIVGTAAPTNGEINATYGLVNLLFDFPMGWGFTPFFGAGVGYGRVSADFTTTSGVGAHGAGTKFVAEDTSFAWDVTAGIAYPIARNVDLEIAYRFLQFNSVDAVDLGGTGVATSDDLNNHQVNVGVRVHL
jgi:opacity protein-like surface antigen